ncbi:hypothetical protein JVX92_00680 [Microbacterium hominis]|uniref:hypothetical protein n=1 Tax=Microbacterium hominis TaxID=162426 RepID=UPI001962DEAE|nr:hypothetical protein [Microbacterium hominis]QRY40843.1 hypothetical protein JVX92_00680 [Microbacterium hominis]
MNEDTANTGTVLVTLGRIEERLAGMHEKETRTNDRLSKVEERLSSIELNLATNVRPKAPWYSYVVGIGGVLLLGLNGFALFDLLAKLAEVTP